MSGCWYWERLIVTHLVSIDHRLTILYSGPTTSESHWVRFIWRKQLVCAKWPHCTVRPRIPYVSLTYVYVSFPFCCPDPCLFLRLIVEHVSGFGSWSFRLPPILLTRCIFHNKVRPMLLSLRIDGCCGGVLAFRLPFTDINSSHQIEKDEERPTLENFFPCRRMYDILVSKTNRLLRINTLYRTWSFCTLSTSPTSLTQHQRTTTFLLCMKLCMMGISVPLLT